MGGGSIRTGKSPLGRGRTLGEESMPGWVTVSAFLSQPGSQELGTAATAGQLVLQGAVSELGIGSEGLQLHMHGNLGYSG